MYLINIKKLEKESVYIKYNQIGKTWLKNYNFILPYEK